MGGSTVHVCTSSNFWHYRPFILQLSNPLYCMMLYSSRPHVSHKSYPLFVAAHGSREATVRK